MRLSFCSFAGGLFTLFVQKLCTLQSGLHRSKLCQNRYNNVVDLHDVEKFARSTYPNSDHAGLGLSTSEETKAIFYMV